MELPAVELAASTADRREGDGSEGSRQRGSPAETGEVGRRERDEDGIQEKVGDESLRADRGSWRRLQEMLSSRLRDEELALKI